MPAPTTVGQGMNFVLSDEDVSCLPEAGAPQGPVEPGVCSAGWQAGEHGAREWVKRWWPAADPVRERRLAGMGHGHMAGLTVPSASPAELGLAPGDSRR